MNTSQTNDLLRRLEEAERRVDEAEREQRDEKRRANKAERERRNAENRERDKKRPSYFVVETDKELTSKGPITNPRNKLCPKNLRPWPDFFE
ncbi:hypothetical protein TruAng_012218 [Truncatella angustata]|nr:hypothetical protein TruAng_012218 [Truncatella angustata]